MIRYTNGDSFRLLSPTDSLIKVDLPTRAFNALTKANILTIRDLLKCDKQSLLNLRGMGERSADETIDFLNHLSWHTDGQPVYPLSEKNALRLGFDFMSFPATLGTRELPPEFETLPLENLNLSVRSYHCLRRSGIHSIGAAAKLSRKELLSMRNLGVGSANEIAEKLDHYLSSKTIKDVLGLTLSSPVHLACFDFFQSISLNTTAYNIPLYRKVLKEFEDAHQQGRAVDFNSIYQINDMRNIVINRITQILQHRPLGDDKTVVYGCIPENYSLSPASFDDILSELERNRVIQINGTLISLQRMSVRDVLAGIQNERFKTMVSLRLQGVTLAEIAKLFGVTSERVRQVTVNGIKNIHATLEEDKYLELFEKYSFTKEEFTCIFDERPETYFYLSMMCKKTKRLSIMEFQYDPDLPDHVVRRIQNYINQCTEVPYIHINGEKVECSKAALIEFLLRTYFPNGVSVSVLMEKYTEVLHDLGLEGDPKLVVHRRSLCNQLRNMNSFLFSPGFQLRYYDIDSRDFNELLSTLKLEQYHDVDHPSGKFFLEEPELMEQYDIRNEFELHNLLRKLHSKGMIRSNISFKRMPIISFGK